MNEKKDATIKITLAVWDGWNTLPIEECIDNRVGVSIKFDAEISKGGISKVHSNLLTEGLIRALVINLKAAEMHGLSTEAEQVRHIMSRLSSLLEEDYPELDQVPTSKFFRR